MAIKVHVLNLVICECVKLCSKGKESLNVEHRLLTADLDYGDCSGVVSTIPRALTSAGLDMMVHDLKLYYLEG